VNADADDSTPATALEQGLYNFVVVVTDADGATSQADFLAGGFLRESTRPT
jgi:hypothetical protein